MKKIIFGLFVFGALSQMQAWNMTEGFQELYEKQKEETKRVEEEMNIWESRANFNRAEWEEERRKTFERMKKELIRDNKRRKKENQSSQKYIDLFAKYLSNSSTLGSFRSEKMDPRVLYYFNAKQKEEVMQYLKFLESESAKSKKKILDDYVEAGGI